MKKYLFGAIASLFALMAVAFSIPQTQAAHYFRYETGFYNHLDNWTYEGEFDPGDCEDGSVVCVVGVYGLVHLDPKDELLRPFLQRYSSLEEVSEAPEVTARKE